MTARRSTGGVRRLLLGRALLAGASLSFALQAATAAAAERPEGAGVVAAAPSIAWSPCYTQAGPFECATVRVPLDYSRPQGARIPIALTRLRATDPDRRLGSLFLNPGGPGGSGVDFVLGVGQELYTPEVRARFDLVGFDPRGIMRSSGLRCFGTPKQWGPATPPFAFPVTPAEEGVKATADRYLNRACEQRGTRVREHMSTANVARDLDVLRAAVGDDKLSFAGFSYGSYVGATYANMFPGRVRAVVVDGVIDPIAWSTGRGNEALTLPFESRLKSFTGAQETLDEFFRLCDEAGTECAFSGGAQARFAALAERARQAPLHVVFPDGFSFELGYSELVGFTLGAMYSSTVWREFAQVLADVEQASTPARAGARFGAFAAKYGPSLYPNFVEGSGAVACEDSDNPDTYAAWSIAGARADENSLFGRLWTWGSSLCAEWKGFDRGRYMGPFNKQTANPVLVVGSRFDPATRYADAVTLDELLPSSSLLTVNGWGHTSLFMSRCADETVERYLTEIATPPAGATCDQDVAPFEASPAFAAGATGDRVKALSYGNGRATHAGLASREAAPLRGRPAPRGTKNWVAPSAGTSAVDALAPRIGLDDRRNAVYAWTAADSVTGSARALTRTRSAAGVLGEVVGLSEPGVDAFEVQVAVNAAGAAVFGWSEFDPDAGTLVVKSRSRSAAGVLGPVAVVSALSTDAFSPRLAISRTGEALLTWTAFDLESESGGVHAQARTRSAAGTLGPLVDLADRALDSFDSQVAIGDDGVAAFSWTQGDQVAGKIRVQARTRGVGGALGAVVNLTDGTRDSGEAKVAVDRDGDVVLTWLSFPSHDQGIVQARSLSRTGSLGPLADLSAPADDAWDAVVAVGDDGAAVFSWWVVGRTGARVELRARSAAGTIGPRSTLSEAADDAFEPQVAVDRDGDAVITWVAFDRDGVQTQARSRSRSGALGPLAHLSPSAEDATGAQVAGNDAGDVALGASLLDGDAYVVIGRSRSAIGLYGLPAVISASPRAAIEAQAERAARQMHR